VNCALARTKILICAPYSKERFETARQNSILHPERIVGNREVIPRNVREKRALPPQIARAASVPGSGKRVKLCRNSDGYGFAEVAVFSGENKFPWNLAEVVLERPRLSRSGRIDGPSLMPV
jgi:hypothetical protein